jgi:hypothetical protein
VDFVNEGKVVADNCAVGGRRSGVTVFEKADEETEKGQHSVGFGVVGR